MDFVAVTIHEDVNCNQFCRSLLLSHVLMPTQLQQQTKMSDNKTANDVDYELDSSSATEEGSEAASDPLS